MARALTKATVRRYGGVFCRETQDSAILMMQFMQNAAQRGALNATTTAGVAVQSLWAGVNTLEAHFRYLVCSNLGYKFQWPVIMLTTRDKRSKEIKVKTISKRTKVYGIFLTTSKQLVGNNSTAAYRFGPSFNGSGSELPTPLFFEEAMQMCAFLCPTLPPRTIRYVGDHYESNWLDVALWKKYVQSVNAHKTVEELLILATRWATWNHAYPGR